MGNHVELFQWILVKSRPRESLQADISKDDASLAKTRRVVRNLNIKLRGVKIKEPILDIL